MKNVEEFVDQIGLADGDRLPAERELAARLGISRRALRQQLLALELDGRVWRGVGQGTFVGPKPAAAKTLLDVSYENISPHIVLDARLQFEPVTASVAASRATSKDLETMETCARRNAEATDDLSWSRWDGSFHRCIATATRNAVTIALAEALISARQQASWGNIRRERVDSDLRRQSAADHWQIFSAIQKRDPEEAAQAMRNHLHNIARMLRIGMID